MPRFTQLSHYPSPAPTLSGLGHGCRQGTSCTPVIPPAIILWTLPNHVGSNILKAVFPYANYNANPSPSLCLQRRNSAQQSCLPQAHRARAQLPSLISRGSCHSSRVDSLLLIPCLLDFCPLGTSASIRATAAHGLLWRVCMHICLLPCQSSLQHGPGSSGLQLVPCSVKDSPCRLRSHAS